MTSYENQLSSPPATIRGFHVAPPSIFDYHDYRSFLRDVIQTRRRNDSTYTIAKFAKTLGFASHSGLIMVLNGRRELRAPYIERCIKNLALGPKQRLYFESLVRMGDLTPEKRKALLIEMQFHNATWDCSEVTEEFRLLDFFLVRQILSLYRRPVSAKRILRHFRYQVTPKHLQDILSWMSERGYVESHPDGFRIARTGLMVKDEVPHLPSRQMHRDCLQFAAMALDEDPVESREFQTYLATIDSKRLPEMKQRIKRMVLDIASEYVTELDGDTVVQFHFNLFQLSKKLGDLEVKEF